MDDLVIQAEGLSKKYHIGARREKYRTLGDTLTKGFVKPFRRVGKLMRGHATAAAELNETFWALDNVNFEITRGEAVAIIGRNGSGKSTLLKILSRITTPTIGFADISGRVGSLLEVGTGFHDELTGRENIYLNGAILGMKRAEIRRKFDEIVAFAEVEKFVDTPVKHYSSGMYLRLAFAVAAHLEPEILLVDEVLAVGDIRFQKRCLNKMQEIGSQGRTVLFVSHNMQAVTRLCQRAILLHEGRVLRDGPSPEVVGDYYKFGMGSSALREWPDPSQAPGGEIARLRAVRVKSETGSIVDTADVRQPIRIEMEYDVLTSGYKLMPHYHINNGEGIHVFSTHDLDLAWRRRPRPAGHYVSTVHIPGNLLSEGQMFVSSGLCALEPFIGQFFESDVVAFQIVDSSDGDSARGEWHGNMGGTVRPYLPWTTNFNPADRPDSIQPCRLNGGAETVS